MSDRTIMTNVPTVDQSPPNLTDLVLRLNPHLYTPPLANPSREDARAHIEAMDDALELCSKLLKLDATKRVSAKDALNHLFFQGRGMDSDGEDREQEILSGVDGKCGHLHSVADGKRRSYSFASLWLIKQTKRGSTRIVRKCNLDKVYPPQLINVCLIPKDVG